MQLVVVVSKNLLDLTKIRSAAKQVKHDVVTCSAHSRIISMMSAGAGDRKFKLIFDYSLYADGSLGTVLSQIEDTALKYRLRGTEFISFAPHEQVEELESAHPGIKFVPRSKFFHDVGKYLT